MKAVLKSFTFFMILLTHFSHAGNTPDKTPNHPFLFNKSGSTEWAQPGSRGQREALMRSVDEFFGDARGTYIDTSRLPNIAPENRSKVSVQFNSVFEDIPYPEVILKNGNRLLYAAQVNNVETKAILVASGNSIQILAAALLHFNCGKNNARDRAKKSSEPIAPCDKLPTLTVFYSGRVAPNVEINEQLKAWVEQELAEHNEIIKRSPMNQIKTFQMQVKTIKTKN